MLVLKLLPQNMHFQSETNNIKHFNNVHILRKNYDLFSKSRMLTVRLCGGINK